jgi:hypothetical protein
MSGSNCEIPGRVKAQGDCRSCRLEEAAKQPGGFDLISFIGFFQGISHMDQERGHHGQDGDE